MKSTRLFQAFNGISEQYLIEAENCGKRGKRAKILKILIPAAAVAALLAIAVLAVAPMLSAEPGQDTEHFTPASRYEGIGEIAGIVDPTGVLSDFGSNSADKTPARTAIDELVFDKYDDHIVITDYIGDDTTIVLPGKIDDLPITKVEIPEKTAEILEAIHFNDESLEDVVVPVTKPIKLTVGKNVERIDSSLLHNAGVSEFEVESGNQNYASFCGMLYNKNCTTLISCPAGCKTPVIDYHPNNQYVTGKFTSYLAAQLQTISDKAFFNCSGVRSVTLPDRLTSIGQKAFAGCSSLRSLTIPQSVQTISGSAFDRCSDLSYIRYHGSYEDFARFKADGLTLPETAGLYFDLSNDASEEELNGIKDLFLYAEDSAALLSRYRMIDCSSETNENGAKLVCAEGIGCTADLTALLAQSFDEKLAAELLQAGIEDYEETNGRLYAYKKTPPADYADGRDEREYGAVRTSDGWVLTVRCTVPLLRTKVFVDCRYELKEENGAYLFTTSFTLPAQAWYGLYLVENSM